MCRWFQFVLVGTAARRIMRHANSFILLMMLCMCPLAMRAQGVQSAALPGVPIGTPLNAPRDAIGQIEGNDISVEGGGASTNGALNGTPRMYVSNGSVVTVHSGNARMTLFAGGQVSICGPAKLTMLQSEGSITLALNFGRVRTELPAKTPLRVFTPTIIATPIDISGHARDVAVGLGLDDSLCVVATSGAMQLEHQFSGEKLIVPQDGEFFLAEGKLVPVAGTRGSCQCADLPPRMIPATPVPAPQTAHSAPPMSEAALAAAITAAEAAAHSQIPAPASSAPASASAAVTLQPEPVVEFSIPAHANEAHPIPPAAKSADAGAPPATAPVYTVVVPLNFSASAPVPPADPTPDMALLIREAKVSPDWELSGHVAAPEFAVALQHALGESAAKSTASSQAASQSTATAARQADSKPEQRKKGFWASLKRAFSGN